MSFTAIYTPLYPLEYDASDISPKPGATTPGAKILNPDGLDDAVPDWSTEMVTKERTDRSEYPAQQWESLVGFRTWGEEGDRLNIERLGFYYCIDDAIGFWSDVSEHTEPFQFLTSPFDGGWLHALDIATLDGSETAAMHVVCHSGDIWMVEIPVSPGRSEVVDP